MVLGSKNLLAADNQQETIRSMKLTETEEALAEKLGIVADSRHIFEQQVLSIIRADFKTKSTSRLFDAHMALPTRLKAASKRKMMEFYRKVSGK